MNTVIVYGSQYGTAREYAETLGKLTKLPVVNYENAEHLEEYEQVVYIGALYAGGVKGLKVSAKRLGENTRLILATVGLADLRDEENIRNIRNGIQKQIPQRYAQLAGIFHLRGGIDYSKLNFKHKTMMTLLYHKAKGLSENQKTAEVRAMIETFGATVNFVDHNALLPIVEAMK